MKNTLLTAIFLAGASLLTANANNPTDINPGRVSALGNVTVTTGRNLSRRVVEATSANAGIKKLAPVKINKGLRADGRKAPRKAIIEEESSVIFYEGFESVVMPNGYVSTDELPVGWTKESHGEVESPIEDKWYLFNKDYVDKNLFIELADGNNLAGIWYDDDVYTDEWLISPSFNIPGEGYQLKFHWYTVPYYFYTIDREHIDFEDNVFIDRELNCNVDIMVKIEGCEWEKIYDIEQEFKDLEYGEIRDKYDYVAWMPEVSRSLNQFAGKNVQIAFRYYGKGGNNFYLDGISVELPGPEISYMPHYSRLFFGFDDDIWWLSESIEFYPVNQPLYWENNSRYSVKKDCEFNWYYTELDDLGRVVEKVSDDPDYLTVTYHPDYINANYGTLMNNIYPTPQMRARASNGAISNYAPWVDYLQAGGTTEFILDDEETGAYRVKYAATNFDIIHEGLTRFVEADEDLRVVDVPIFGYDVNSDAWWMKYTYPNGNHGDDSKYAYVDGFANMFFPPLEGALVVGGVKVAAHGIIYDDAQFTLKIYTMYEDGYLVDQPIHTQTIKGSDVIQFSDGMSRKYLVLNFPFDEPMVFSNEGTGYGYMVEISGYHDPNIESFCPLQSSEPNQFGWSTSFYHKYTSLYAELDPDHTLTDEFCYIGYFKDELGREIDCSFAIGLDAHYPWLELDGEGNDAFTVTDEATKFNLRGYYGSADYTVSAPDWVDVKLAGRYQTQVIVTPTTEVVAGTTVPVTFTAPGVEMTVDVPLKSLGSVGNVGVDNSSFEGKVYNAQGILMMDNATEADLDRLPAGLYIHNGRKVLVK